MKTLHCISALWFALVLAGPARSQTITTVAGNSTWSLVRDVFVDTAGNMYVADSAGAIYKIDPQGVQTTIAGATAGSPRAFRATAVPPRTPSSTRR